MSYIDPETGEITDRPRDLQIDAAKVFLMENYFKEGSEEVYYGRQLEIFLEKNYFHWITKKALNELSAERKITMTIEQTEHSEAHFYTARDYRYPRRKINEVLSIISAFSHHSFGMALGHTGEALADAGFATIGFRIRDRNVNKVDDRQWSASGHDLDRLIERDGIRYGVEVKNQLGYIERDEFRKKLDMCQFFGIRPFFIVRAMPKSYINEVYERGGFVLVLQHQHYPLLGESLMKRVRNTLSLPVAIITALPDTTLKRFEAWHEKQLPSM